MTSVLFDDKHWTQILIEKLQPIFYFFIDESKNDLVVAFDEHYASGAAARLSKEITPYSEFLDVDSIQSKFIPESKATQFSIKFKKPC